MTPVQHAGAARKRFTLRSHPNQAMHTPAPLCQHSKALLVLAAAVALTAAPHRLRAQASDPKAQAAVEAAVRSELAAAKSDTTNWEYRDHDVSPGKNATYRAVETPHGELKRLVELNGRPLTGDARQNESERLDKFVNDPSEQARQRKAGAHDDAQAEAMLRMLPRAYTWTVASETTELLTLEYRPSPAFDPPNMEARVMSAMAGQMVIVRDGNRIRTLKGSLTQDIKIGFGILGRLYQGGTFDVERRQIAPGHWEITETHVHIGGHVLLFKNIGQQDDEDKTEWKPSPARTLQEAEDLLRDAR
jgi:hypothetical protein